MSRPRVPSGLPQGGEFTTRRRPEAATGLADPVTDHPAGSSDDLSADPFGFEGDLTWRSAGFTPFESARWAEAGVVSPELALRLNTLGVNSSDASKIYVRLPAAGGEPPLDVTYGQAVEMGVLDPEDAARITGHSAA